MASLGHTYTEVSSGSSFTTVTGRAANTFPSQISRSTIPSPASYLMRVILTAA